LIGFTPEAEDQIDRLRSFYIETIRSGALRNFLAALQTAVDRIERTPDAGSPAPCPYPELTRSGRAWIKVGRYWIAYSTTKPPVVVGVFFETADIPNLI
jgi:plasmid stabilization system protein ParE